MAALGLHCGLAEPATVAVHGLERRTMGIFVLTAFLSLAWFKGLWVYWFAASAQLQGSGLGTIQITPGTK